MSDPYDSSPIYTMVRKRHNDLRDRVQKLMFREAKLEEDVEKQGESHKKLKDAIARVLQIPADASELQRMAKETGEKLERDREEFALVQKELALVRDAMKYADMAHEALHWARFADQALERFDREMAPAADALQKAG